MEIKKQTEVEGEQNPGFLTDPYAINTQFFSVLNTLTLACEERWKLQEERKKEIFKQVDSKNL
jgi:hypothetical protein